MWTATATLNVSRAEDLTRIRNLRSQRGIGHSEDLTKKGSYTTWLPCRREQDHIQTSAGCDKLRDIVEDREYDMGREIRRPEADMVIHHTVIERAHVGWLEADNWSKPELELRGAIIAKRVGYGTTIAYVPSPTQVLNQLPGSESSCSESPLLAQGMDYDTFVYVHCGGVWVRVHVENNRRARGARVVADEDTQPKSILLRFGLTSSTWSEQAARNLKTDPAHPTPMNHRHIVMCKFLWMITMNYHSERSDSLSGSRGTARLPSW